MPNKAGTHSQSQNLDPDGPTSAGNDGFRFYGWLNPDLPAPVPGEPKQRRLSMSELEEAETGLGAS